MKRLLLGACAVVLALAACDDNNSSNNGSDTADTGNNTPDTPNEDSGQGNLDVAAQDNGGPDYAPEEDLPPDPVFKVTVPAINPDGTIGAPYVCNSYEDLGISPAISWENAPIGTYSYAVIVRDVDAGNFLHWLMWDIPDVTSSLPEGIPTTDTTHGKQGLNDFSAPGWGGPCPPPGSPHHYVFTVVAVGIELVLEPGISPVELIQAIESAALDTAQVTAIYQR